MSIEDAEVVDGELVPAEPAAGPGVDLVQMAPGLARIAAGAWLRTAQWSAESGLRLTTRLLRAATSGETAAELLEEAAENVREQARRLLDLDGQRPREPVPERDRAVASEAAVEPGTGGLRERGAELLRRSADIDHDEPAHPAYARILDDLAPDEARILRFLYLDGPQPSVDVRASKIPLLNSQMVAPGLSIVGSQAGCRFLERVPAYLNNLYRLGLIWFSREPLEDPLRYQVLEAQPEVVEALRAAGRGRTVRRSIHLTPFGEDFCRVCLPLDTAEMNAVLGDDGDGDAG